MIQESILALTDKNIKKNEKISLKKIEYNNR